MLYTSYRNFETGKAVFQGEYGYCGTGIGDYCYYRDYDSDTEYYSRIGIDGKVTC